MHKDSDLLNVEDTRFRDITPLETKKLAKMKSEDEKLHKIHILLSEQEKVFCNFAPTVNEKNFQPKNLVTKLLDHQFDGISWMREREKSVTKGGILADEMGMGKTVQMLGLILSTNIEEVTLIIVPTVAIDQWMSEISRHTKNVNSILYYGRHKNDDPIKNAMKLMHNIIITSYGTIEAEYRKKIGVLHKIQFDRIVLDEAQLIKDTKSSTNAVISHLKASYRWGMTGTPVQNRISDLYSLVKFLRLDPHAYYFCKKCDCKSLFWLNYHLKSEKTELRRGFCTCGHFGASHFGWWNRRISNQIKGFGYTTKGKDVFEALNKITSHIILRRTKANTDLGLPSKRITILKNYFSEEEKKFYTSLYSGAQKEFMAYAIRGQITHNYAHIFELLQKMRLAVNHPYLVQKIDESPPICSFCNEEAEDPVISKCKHIFCREEARFFLEENPICPSCKVKITIDLNQKEMVSYSPKLYIKDWISSTKIECLIEQLVISRNENSLTKSIVFSQFVNFLEMLKWRLERAGFRTVSIYGSMPISQRKTAIEEFNTNKEIVVFLISLKAGGVALNLTAASHVYIMDLWWNPAVEEQAMDRIHRIGQFRAIRIYKIIIEDSIESKILALQEKKKALFDSTVENDIRALERVSEDDLMFLFT